MKSLWALTLAGALCLSACGLGFFKAISECEAAGELLVTAMNAGDYQAVRQILGADLQARYSPDLASETFARIRAEVGSCERPQTVRANAQYKGDGTTVYLEMKSTCEITDLAAALVWKMEEGEPKLLVFSFQKVIASSDQAMPK